MIGAIDQVVEVERRGRSGRETDNKPVAPDRCGAIDWGERGDRWRVNGNVRPPLLWISW